MCPHGYESEEALQSDIKEANSAIKTIISITEELTMNRLNERKMLSKKSSLVGKLDEKLVELTQLNKRKAKSKGAKAVTLKVTFEPYSGGRKKSLKASGADKKDALLRLADKMELYFNSEEIAEEEEEENREISFEELIQRIESSNGDGSDYILDLVDDKGTHYIEGFVEGEYDEALDVEEIDDMELDEKLIDVPQEDKEAVENKLVKLGFEIEGKGKTLFGRDHWQLVKKLDHDIARSDMEPILAALRELDDEMWAKKIPMTYSLGQHKQDPRWISLAIDLDKKAVEDESLNEGNYGFKRKYRGCSIYEMPDVFVVTNEHGKTIGQSRTESGCEGIIDAYLDAPNEVEESCEKEDNKSMEECDMQEECALKEAVNDADKAAALAKLLEIEVDEISWGNDDLTYETPYGDYYVGTEEEMNQLALEHESAMIDDMGLDLFTPYFRDQIIGDPDMFDAHWFKEYWDEYNEQADELDQIEVNSDEQAVQLFADTFGDEHLVDVINREDLLDKEAITKEVIRLDGRESILAPYSGEEEDLGNGLFAYRYN